MLYNIECVLFDFDGTLADTIELHVLSFEEALRNFGINDINPREIKEKIGMTAREILEKLAEIHPEIVNVDIDTIIKEKNRIYSQKFDKYVKPHEGAKEILEFLKKNNKCVGLVTSSSKELVDIFFDKYKELKTYFDFIVSEDEVLMGKPHPDLYLKAIERSNKPRNTILAVEDSAYGVVAAKSAGIHVVGVLTGVGDRKLLKSLGAIKVFKNLVELKKFLEKTNFKLSLTNLMK